MHALYIFKFATVNFKFQISNCKKSYNTKKLATTMFIKDTICKFQTLSQQFVIPNPENF